MSKKWYQKRDDELETCSICKIDFELGQMYEYRGALACGECIEEMREKETFKEQKLLENKNLKRTDLKGLICRILK